MLRVPNFVRNYTIGYANLQIIILMGTLFYTQGFILKIIETACMSTLALKINYNLGSTFCYFLQEFYLLLNST